MERLIAILRQARNPVLVHCSWGTDRSGLAFRIVFGSHRR
ncbi:tyrosine-protein phosphatase [Neorhizobium petrolearium]